MFGINYLLDLIGFNLDLTIYYIFRILEYLNGIYLKSTIFVLFKSKPWSLNTVLRLAQADASETTANVYIGHCK